MVRKREENKKYFLDNFKEFSKNGGTLLYMQTVHCYSPI